MTVGGLQRVLVPFGTRPEVIKLAPVVAALRSRGLEVRTVATGQQAAATMADRFYEELGLVPDQRIELPEEPAARLGELLHQAARVVEDEARAGTELVLVLGDTFTVPVFALAARRSRLPVAHLEAGLRSLNPTSMEEVNRRVGAACASLHLAPTELAAGLLLLEGVPADRIKVVGNPVLDVARATGVTRRPPQARQGIVVTAHRATNVDDPARLANLVALLEALGRRHPPVRFPVHPRTADRLRAFGLADRLAQAQGVVLSEPLGYQAMLEAMAACQVVVTDSGGIQEEAAYLGVPVVVLRRSTPRWEGVALGAAVLSGLDPEEVLAAVERLATPAQQERVAGLPCPYGDGHAAERVADVLQDPATKELLALDEPDFRRSLPAVVQAALDQVAAQGASLWVPRG
ncbi:non-hydrolyzing UDP-N-acetylglucosamine 2-epimerase [Aciditerrimonas ferrireducens]|uniref:Non-hydrolyzing UDP-N-acetylglucosamine 2-epimerase n=1 Tax=Aciditerrimonas ferrireducens TaxID=667306 RepID=A0ABV6C289_9ACTN